MDINLLIKIGGIGILVAVLHQILTKAGREDQAMMTSLAGLIIVLTIVIKEISTLFTTVRTVFNLWTKRIATEVEHIEGGSRYKMEIIKIIGIGFVTLIITIIFKEYKKELAIYPILIGGAIILSISLDILKNIIDFINEISSNSAYNSGFISLLIKITGISILTEYAVSICKDSGESAIANKIDLGGKVIVISMSIPVIGTTLESLTKLLLW